MVYSILCWLCYRSLRGTGVPQGPGCMPPWQALASCMPTPSVITVRAITTDTLTIAAAIIAIANIVVVSLL